jgi:hypothetical protein
MLHSPFFLKPSFESLERLANDDLVLSTATFLTVLPFRPVSPACSDAVTVIR